MAIELNAPSFKPREYEGEYILYTLYGLDSDGDELDDIITSPKKSTVTHTIKELLPDFRRIYNGMHVVAILYDKNDHMLDSAVVWSTDQNEANDAAEGPYIVYSLDKETGVSKDGEYPTWRKAYNALADGTVWDHGSSNNFVFHGNHLQQIYKYKKTGRTGKWSGNGYDVIFDREISEDPADYIKANFTPTRYNACHFNESKGTDEENNSELGEYMCTRGFTHGNLGVIFRKGRKYTATKTLPDGRIEVSGFNVSPEFLASHFEKIRDEKLEYEKGHKNSKGEDAPWVIRSHKDNSVLASFPTKKEAENHMKTMKRYSKSEGKFTEIKAAIKAAWSAAEAKWFRLNFQESTERLDVYPIASDNEGVGVNWGVLPERSIIAQYATDLRTGNSEIEREMPYKDLDELEKIFVDEFKSMDETLEIGAENGADIHPLTESRPTESEVDKFLYNALDWASIDDDVNRVILKFVADAGEFELIGYDGRIQKTLKSGQLFSVVDRFRELVEMDQADAIREFEKE